MEHTKSLFNDIITYIKTDGWEYAKNQAKYSTLNYILDSQVVPIVMRYIKINMIWNIALIITIILNRFIFPTKLLMLYYLASCGSTFYGINQILSKIESKNLMLAITIPYTLSGVRKYLTKISILLAVETVGIFFDWNMDVAIYLLIICCTIHTLSLDYTISLCNSVYTCINLNSGLRNCTYFYVAENVIVLVLYGLLK